MPRAADVIVVGGGMAGLKAALDLVARGRSVILLEANDRAGGRLKAAEVSGRVVDPGGQWVGVGHDVRLQAARRYGIETYPPAFIPAGDADSLERQSLELAGAVRRPRRG